jgi:hypothetical protein
LTGGFVAEAEAESRAWEEEERAVSGFAGVSLDGGIVIVSVVVLAGSELDVEVEVGLELVISVSVICL